jgi:hypothetical protein
MNAQGNLLLFSENPGSTPFFWRIFARFLPIFHNKKQFIDILVCMVAKSATDMMDQMIISMGEH